MNGFVAGYFSLLSWLVEVDLGIGMRIFLYRFWTPFKIEFNMNLIFLILDLFCRKLDYLKDQVQIPHFFIII
jgi:hypothetical protein